MARNGRTAPAHGTTRNRLIATLVLSLWLALGAPPGLAQQRGIFYVYDDLNRLVAVVDQQGSVATYSYDAVGNILRIDRVDATAITAAVGITLVSPGQGQVGTEVQIFGKGFSALAGENGIAFNGTSALVRSAGPNRLVTVVPDGATTGSIVVTTPRGSAISPRPFVVLGTLTISPTTAIVSVDGSVQFQAQESGAATTSVRWAVNGIPGGDAPIGTIAATGLYTAPAVMPTPAAVTVSAIHAADAVISALATVTIQPRVRGPVFLTSRSVSVAITAPPPAPALTFVTTPGVSVAVAAPPSTAVLGVFAVTPGVSLAVAPPPASAPSQIATSVSGLVSVAPEPVITAVAPAGALAGTALSVTLTGAGLSGATSLTILRNDAPDPSIAAQNLVVDGTGTRATVDLVIAAGAPLGPRVLQINTPHGASPPVALGGNVFSVQ